ncbi:MAG: transposase [Burkholderiales bacterium]|nr:transposase [Burkholderiales bacterium]
MARLNRLVVPGEVHLVRQSAVPGALPFHDGAECEAFLASLRRAATERGVTIHGYALLPDTWLLLCTPAEEQSLGRMMQAISRWFVAAYNRRHGREGALWRSRFTAAPLAAGHVIDCLVYVEQAPVRAGLVQSPAEYPWSSAGPHVTGGRDLVLSSSVALWSLGNTPFEREAAHRRMLDGGLATDKMRQIEGRLLKGWGWANPEVLVQWTATGRRTVPMPRGRPSKVKVRE